MKQLRTLAVQKLLSAWEAKRNPPATVNTAIATSSKKTERTD